ncbi:hypothetical protein GCM10011297_30070 [Bacterioplanes sanyensis]|uniref:hypothetical protein n=1 Tax=Bacterioplanes sanyensis TaxID=1249553 RepID=UPI00167208AD|nr:hypothetical protein [Bacterioplanes sanyensis]GGY55150.1 hypothetical protein GCM10011297_30070 [Bacterioplanes sanyensis]
MKTLQKILLNKYLLITLSAIALVAVFVSLMPKPIDMTLENIGNGRPSVVFIYDLNLATSNPQTVEMNKARDLIGDGINFLVAKAGDPTTQAFRQSHQASSSDLLFFNSEGKLIDRSVAVIPAEVMIQRMSDK